MQEDLLAVYDFYIVPVANPDGYVYSWTSDRMWRKNRRPLSVSPAGQQQQLWGWGSPGTQSTKVLLHAILTNNCFQCNFIYPLSV